MYLTRTKQRVVDKKRELIKNSDIHLECHRKCEKCSGTGLEGVNGFDGSYSWDGVSFCDHCNGIGYIMFKNTVLLKKCSYCDGAGCDKCNNQGILDWVQYLRVGDK